MRAVGAHQRGEIILQLALAGVAAADPHALAGRRRIDVEAGARRELGHRIDVGRVNPVCAAIERQAEAGGSVTQRPPIRLGRLDQREAAARRRRACARRQCRRRPRRRSRHRRRPQGSTRALGECRPCRHCGEAGQNASSGPWFHGLRMVLSRRPSPIHARTRGRLQTWITTRCRDRERDEPNCNDSRLTWAGDGDGRQKRAPARARVS